MSPLEAGLWLVPSTGATIASVMLAPVIARRFRPGHVIAAGLTVTAVGYLMLSQVDGSTGMAFVLTGLIVGAVGAGPMGALGTGLIFTSVPPEKTGAASAISETGGEFGIAFGVAVLGSVGAAVYGSQITVPDQVPAAAAAAAREGIAGAVGAAEQVGGTLGAELLTAAREAFTTAMNSATGASAALALALAVVAAIALGHVPPTGQAEAAAGAEGGPEQAGEAAATAQDGRAGEHSAPAGAAAETANASG